MKPGISKYQLLVMAVTAGVCVANIYYNQPILNEIGKSFNATESQSGLISVLTQVGYGLGLFFITPLGDKTERKQLVLILQIALIVLLLGMSFITSLTGIYAISLLIGLLGVAAQVILPMAVSMDNANKGKNVGIIFTGMLIGILSARVFSGYIAEWLGWRYVYLISAGMVAVTAVIFQIVLPRIKQSFGGNYTSLLKSTLAQFFRFGLLRRTAIMGALIFGAFCSFWTTLTFHLSGPPFNYRVDTIGLYGLLAVAGALLVPVFGKLADKGHPGRNQLFTLGLLILGVLLVKFFPTANVALIAAVLLLDVGVQATQVSNIASIYSLDATAHSRINTVYMTCYFIGGAIGTFAGVQCWHIGGWSLVTWQLLIWSVAALLVAVSGSKKTKAI
ncbi:MAG: MFS transporter [Sphingobacteriaceae bacterium]|nr:MAG: MFS transporter [Sphingobacteriaceae bacterium]